MAKTKKSDSPSGATPDTTTEGVAPATAPPNATTLDDHLDAPSVVAPGDAPADTTDPSERASSATPDFASAAKAGHGTVNAVVPVGRTPAPEAPKKPRIERYEATRADGSTVTVEHNIDTGETKVL